MEKSIKLPETIELWELARLRPYPKNSRTHSISQVFQIIDSIKEFGFTQPLLVDPDGEIIAGHGRFEAAKEMQLEKVPVIVLGDLTPEQKRAYVIADNKIALNADWDKDLLREELMALEHSSFKLDVVGFSEKEIQDLVLSLEPTGKPDKQGSKEYSEEEFQEFEHKCPKCNFEFNSPEVD